MNIGEASARSGLPTKTIRYYEEIGLVRPGRLANGYRSYDEAQVRMLQFVHRARDLGFSIEECRSLLSLYLDRGRSSADVKAMALAKLAEIDRRIDRLQAMRRTLTHLAETCHGDERPDCPILDDLAAGPAVPEATDA
ncbi:MAG: Cu(I)-responsive transcriptional regulator [Azospirillaceae bacterium]